MTWHMACANIRRIKLASMLRQQLSCGIQQYVNGELFGMLGDSRNWMVKKQRVSAHACAGAVLASSSWLDRPCFCCMVRQKICCMPLLTTDNAATATPTMFFSICRSVTVLPSRTACAGFTPL